MTELPDRFRLCRRAADHDSQAIHLQLQLLIEARVLDELKDLDLGLLIHGGEVSVRTRGQEVLGPQPVDAVAPATTLNVDRVSADSDNFLVSWDVTDDAGGSGFKHVTLYVATNGGDFRIWQRQLTDASGTSVAPAAL